jgi:indolepyruvate ferredoxin oxidoreductase beta subunit
MNLQRPCNVIIAGVGGQGNLLSGRVLADAALSAGYRPTIGETFGASRRGGTVFTHVRIGSEDIGPLIPAGMADLILGLEPMESLRAAVSYAARNAVVVVSLSPVQTTQSLSGGRKYPSIDDILETLSTMCSAIHPVELSKNLQESSGLRVLSSFVLGAGAAVEKLPMGASQIRESVCNLMIPKDANLAAFDAGLKAVKH